jgi:dimethylamine/trimethylamine dehydrogenase
VGSALTEKLKLQGLDVSYVTSAPIVSAWTQMTDEQYFVETRLVDLGVPIRVSHVLRYAGPEHVEFDHGLSRAPVRLECGTLILVTGRYPCDDLYVPLVNSGQFKSVARIGDCLAPSSIADAVFSGHRLAREFGEILSDKCFKRERPEP